MKFNDVLINLHEPAFAWPLRIGERRPKTNLVGRQLGPQALRAIGTAHSKELANRIPRRRNHANRIARIPEIQREAHVILRIIDRDQPRVAVTVHDVPCGQRPMRDIPVERRSVHRNNPPIVL